MLRKISPVTLSKALSVLLSCTVFVMYSAMIRIYQDPEAPHDMYPGLESCRHIKDLAKHKYDGEYLIRSDMVAQLALMWSQSDCSRYAGLLSNSQEKAAAQANEADSGKQVAPNTEPDDDQAERQGPVLDSANPLDGFSWAAAHNLALVGDFPSVAVSTITSSDAHNEPVFSSRTEEVTSPPPRALG
jgi:hypothetical protein